ncbi:hypothetical protein LIA77_05270 [Sarocladium implicatum]|nr:hypothetical protein LIA77_05270 [Sarocladium implicatum]
MSSLDVDDSQAVHDAFVDCLAKHQTSVHMDFDQFLKEVITMILNKAKGNEWPIGQLHKYIDAEARLHSQPRNNMKRSLIQGPSSSDSNAAPLDDPDKYELCFTAAELKACANLGAKTSFSGCRFRDTSDRLYSLFRHKVLGKDPLKLERAISRRRNEVATRDRLAREAREQREQAAREERAREQEESEKRAEEMIDSRGKKRRRVSSGDGDESGSDASSLFGDRNVAAARRRLAAGRADDDSDFELPTRNVVAAASSPPGPAPRSSPPTAGPANVCFREQTAKDRRKMQPEVSKDQRLRQQQAELEEERRKRRKAERERDKLLGEVVDERSRRLQVEGEMEKLRADVARERAGIGEREVMLRREREALESDKQIQASLNSKINKDFW